jgi:hypothetical protein
MKSKGFTNRKAKTGRRDSNEQATNGAGDVHDGKGGQKTHNNHTVDISYFF